MMAQTVGSWWMWLGFVIFVVAMIAVDILALRARGAHRVSVREAAGWSVFWILLALAFAALLWWYLLGSAGRSVADQKTLEYLTGYLIEKALGVDNLFVFLMIFSYFAVPPEYQQRVLLYGVLGAIVMRAVMIVGGALLIARYHWILYLFGAFLLLTGLRMLLFARRAPDLARNPLLKWMRRHLRVTADYHQERFIVRRDGAHCVTPLLLVLVLIEVTDLVFAVDSIPAIFAVTTDPFIVFTSNIFAILGLRAMYFLLADMAERFRLLKYGLGLVLAFIGAKMLAAPWFKVPVGWALAVTGIIIGMTVLASLFLSARRPAAH
ncbi:MAG: TerC family protein [Pseudomonadota bacterium]